MSLRPFFLRLQNKLLITVFFAMLIPLGVVGVFSVQSSSTKIEQLSLDSLKSSAITQVNLMEAFLGNVYEDLVVLSMQPGLAELLEGKPLPATLDATLQSILYSKAAYLSLQVLDAQNRRILLYSSSGGKVSLSTQILDLKDSSHILACSKLEYGSSYVSSIVLARDEKNSVIEPKQPEVIYALPLFDALGQRTGTVMIAVNVVPILDKIRKFKPLEGTQSYLINRSGYFLIHPEPQKEWGFELNHKVNFLSDFGQQASSLLLAKPSASTLAMEHSILAYAPLYHNAFNQDDFMVLILETPHKAVFSFINQYVAKASVIVLLMLAVGLGMSFTLLRRNITLPVETLSIKARIASNGNFHQQFRLNRDDELGDLSTALQSMTESMEKSSQTQLSHVEGLENIMQKIDTVSLHLQEKAQELSDSARILSEHASHQKSSVENIGISIAEASEHNLQTVALIQEGTRLSSEALNQAESGNLVLDQMNEVIQYLGQDSRRVSEVIKVIELIALQTNLLALNAAVEAARAGVHGKGFGVVAGEIRSLAENSARSSADVDEILKTIVDRINGGSSLSQETQGKFAEICDATRKVTQCIDGISQSGPKTVALFQEILQSLKTVNSISLASEQIASKNVAASNALFEQVDHLNHMIQEHKKSNHLEA